MYDKIAQQLREKLKEAVERNKTQGLLFSGGLDSGILAFLCPGIRAITITLNSFGDDLEYARRLAKYCQIEHYQKAISIEEATRAVPEVIKILESFDPAIPNDITTYFGLKLAKQMGIKTVMTGDGSDEIFAGYSFMHNIPDVGSYIKRISGDMYFSSNTLGNFFDLQIKQPYTDKEFVNFCHKIPCNLKLRETNGKFTGKWILRKAFESFLPEEVIWQRKRPLEQGSGTTKLREIIAKKVSQEEFKTAKHIFPVRFMSKEHFYYYRIYRRVVGRIPKALPGERVCPGCGTGLRKQSGHCKICGWTK